ncbi:DUF1311 domain-containing protein [Flavobacterium sp. Root186]|uniref:DUF1311 domain-containing protein n=1 Tax=Flavobacterium sp. Root186 TaxID=1736485 RepID=UPI000A9FFF57|nr:DUF1311 domain-containing protein [Flavobacterium sp. Root186]
MIKNILVLIFSFCLTACFSQNDIKENSDEFINSQIESKIPDLKSLVESNVMNPFTKKLYSDFAIDTFRIGYYFRNKNRKVPVNYKQQVDLVKHVTSRYEKIINKYYQLLKTKSTETQKKALIKSQNAWEIFKKEESLWILTRLRDDWFDYNYYLDYCNIMKQRMIILFDCYIDFEEHGNY